MSPLLVARELMRPLDCTVGVPGCPMGKVCVSGRIHGAHGMIWTVLNRPLATGGGGVTG